MSREVFCNNRPMGRIPSGDMMLRTLLSSESAAEEGSLEFYENWNQAWRTQYKHPSLASMGIGVEFAPRRSRLMSSQSTLDDESENNVVGNSSMSRTVEQALPPALYDYLADMAESEDENLIQFLA
ncbi:hypothetical protein KR018_000665 [Drosophila ironensis]|nr:hypothetical protein KR018_000665 [Drosophila ironensis]